MGGVNGVVLRRGKKTGKVDSELALFSWRLLGCLACYCWGCQFFLLPQSNNISTQYTVKQKTKLHQPIHPHDPKKEKKN